MSDRFGDVETWLGLMESYPPDGWDGAADVIAAHDKQVCELERLLDRRQRGWHKELNNPPPRRTPEPA